MKKLNVPIIVLLISTIPMMGIAISGDNFSFLYHNNLDPIKEDSLLTPKTSANPKNWTFMVYLDADCNLEEAGIDDINEMEMVGSDSNINVVVQIDRRPGYDSSNGDWTGARRYYVTKDYDSGTISSTLVQNLGEVNMGSASTLEDFIQWAKLNYPADKYALILWDHGSGIMWGNSLGGVCWDDSNGGDYLTLTELSNVLSNYNMDLIGFDACLMGALEVHYQLKDYATVIIGSEDLEPGDGYPYNDILDYLINNPDASSASLGQQIVIEYNDFYSYSSSDITQAAVNALTPEFNTSLNNFINDLSSIAKNPIQSARISSLEFDDESYIDLYDFADNIKADVGLSAQFLMDNITNIIIEERHSNSQAGAHGLSIYFPKTLSEYSFNYENTRFAEEHQWDEFLIKYYTDNLPGEYEDNYEENDWFDEAKTLTAGSYNLICNSSDADYFNISIMTGNILNITILFEHSKGDLDLFLFDTTQALVDFSDSTTDNEKISYLAPGTGIYSIVIEQFPPYKEYQPYTLIIDDGSDDIFENNDIWSDAAEIKNNTLYTNLICKDPDFYKFWAKEGWLINITIEFNYAEGDLDLYLYNGTNNELFEASYSATDNENLLYGADYSGWYIIEVHNYENNMNYYLSANVTNVDDSYEPNNSPWDAVELPIDATYINLTCINWDFYNISLITDMWINITIYFEHDGGDLDLYLYNFTGFYYEIISFSISSTDNEFICFNVKFDGHFYIGVYDYEINLDYTLCIYETFSIWDDDFEENDWFDEASKLNINEMYNNLTAIDWDTYCIYAQAGYLINITIDYVRSEGDLDLYFVLWDEYSPDYVWIIGISTSYPDQEQLIFTSTDSGYYYFLVFPNEINMQYNLTISQTKISSNGSGGGGDGGKDGDDDITTIEAMPTEILTSIMIISIGALVLVIYFKIRRLKINFSNKEKRK